MAQLRLDESLRAVEREIAAGHPELALAHCQALQAQFPRAIAVQRALGEIYLAQRKPRDAVAALDRVLQADPEDARACCLRAYVHQMHGDTYQALSWYARACDVRPDDTVLRATYRELAAPLGQPPYAPSRAGLARLYLRGGLYTHAIREWEALITEHPDALDAQVGLAETLWRGNHLQPAIDRCLRILANSPTCIKPMLILAVTHLDAGRMEEAQRLALRAAELDADYHLALALLRDRFNAGDVTLQKVILGAVNQTQPPLLTAPGIGQVGHARDRGSVSRPLVNVGGVPGVADASQVPYSGRVTASSLSELPVDRARDPRLISRVKQTEIMLGQGPARPATPMPVSATSYLSDGPALVPPTGGPKMSFMPPMLAERGANLQDAEVRQGLEWLNWLHQQGKAQGASAPPAQSPMGTPPMGTPPMVGSGTPPIPAQPGTSWGGAPSASANHDNHDLMPTMLPAFSSGQAGQPGVPAQPSVSNLTGPLPLPSAAELRAMFAELGATSAVGPAAFGASNGAPDASFVDTLATAVPGLTAEQRRTLESIEREYANSGFQQVEARPGLLAELAAQPATEREPVSEAPRTSYEDAPARSAGDDHAARDVAQSGAHATEPGEAEPPDTNFAHQLAEARRQRAAGNLDAALSAYGIVLRGAPDLAPDVIGDLEAEVESQPMHPGLHQLLGDARIRQGDYLGALESYNHAVALGQESR